MASRLGHAQISCFLTTRKNFASLKFVYQSDALGIIRLQYFIAIFARVKICNSGARAGARSLVCGPRASDLPFSFEALPNFRRSSIFENSRKSCMAQSRRHERARSSRLQHSASFRATKPNKASMTLMLAAARICATDALERQLAPPRRRKLRESL